MVTQTVIDLAAAAVRELGIDFVEIVGIPAQGAECGVHGAHARASLAAP